VWLKKKLAGCRIFTENIEMQIVASLKKITGGKNEFT